MSEQWSIYWTAQITLTVGLIQFLADFINQSVHVHEGNVVHTGAREWMTDVLLAPQSVNHHHLQSVKSTFHFLHIIQMSSSTSFWPDHLWSLCKLSSLFLFSAQCSGHNYKYFLLSYRRGGRPPFVGNRSMWKPKLLHIVCIYAKNSQTDTR